MTTQRQTARSAGSSTGGRRGKTHPRRRLDDETKFTLRQILQGNDEGLVMTAEHDGRPVAMLLAQVDAGRGVMHVHDLRVDYDNRRQGIATVMLYQLIETARDADLRAAYIATRTNNAPIGRLLEKLGWELSGLDTKRHDNHDLVKESATLLWYYVIR
ncbi:MAG: GNAT family N-acetyltransferase [Tepidisphaeraceae bacterium]